MLPSRIVVRAPNWLGDIIMALPAIATIRQHYPNAHLSVAMPEGFAPLMSAVPGVDGVVWLARGGGLSSAEINTRTVRAGKFDLAVLLTSSFSSALIMYQAEVKERWGYDGEMRGRLLTRAVVPPPQAQRLPGDTGRVRPHHHSTYYLRMLQAFGMQSVTSVPPLQVPEQFRRRADRLFDAHKWPVAHAAPMIAVAPGAAYGSAKRWPVPHVATLVRRLIDAGLRPVFVGAKNDLAMVTEVEAVITSQAEAAGAAAAAAGSAAGGGADVSVGVGAGAAGDVKPVVVPVAGEHYLNLVGKTELAQLMAVLLETWAVVSNDSGAMHVAAAINRPVVALFGPTDELVTAPLGSHIAVVTHDVSCRPCMLRECPIDHRCLRDLPPDEVFAAVERVRRPPDPRPVPVDDDFDVQIVN